MLLFSDSTLAFKDHRERALYPCYIYISGKLSPESELTERAHVYTGSACRERDFFRCVYFCKADKGGGGGVKGRANTTLKSIRILQPQ